MISGDFGGPKHAIIPVIVALLAMAAGFIALGLAAVSAFEEYRQTTVTAESSSQGG